MSFAFSLSPSAGPAVAMGAGTAKVALAVDALAADVAGLRSARFIPTPLSAICSERAPAAGNGERGGFSFGAASLSLTGASLSLSFSFAGTEGFCPPFPPFTVAGCCCDGGACSRSFPFSFSPFFPLLLLPPPSAAVAPSSLSPAADADAAAAPLPPRLREDPEAAGASTSPR